MVAVNHHFVEQLTGQSDNSGAYVTLRTIPAAELLANTKYLIIVDDVFNGSVNNKNFDMRVSTADDTTIATLSESIVRPKSSGFNPITGAPYFFVRSFTTSATPTDVLLQFRTLDTAVSVQADQMTFGVIDLTDFGSGNFFETLHADDASEYSTTQTTEFSIAGASLGTDEWAVLGYQRTGVNSTGRNFRVEVLSALDTSTNAVVLTDEQEGANNFEKKMTGFAVRHKASSGTPDFEVQSWKEGSQVTAENNGGYAIALKTSALRNFVWAYTAAAVDVDTPEATFQTITSYSPDADADHLFFGSWNTINVAGDDTTMHIEDDGAEMRVGDEETFTRLNKDATNDPTSILCHLDNILASDTSTYTLRGKARIDSTMQLEHRWLLILSLEKAAGAAVSQTVVAPLEALGGILSTAVLPLESLLDLSALTSPVLEARGGIRGSVSPVLEALGAARATAIAPLEAKGTVLSTAVLPLESLLDLSGTVVAPIEARGGIAGLVSPVLEALGGIDVTVILPLEAGGRAVATIVLPLESLLDLFGTTAAVIESLGALRATVPIPYEALQATIPFRRLRGEISRSGIQGGVVIVTTESGDLVSSTETGEVI